MNKKMYRKFIAKLYKCGARVKWIDREHEAIKFCPKQKIVNAEVYAAINTEVYVAWSQKLHCPYVTFEHTKDHKIYYKKFLDTPHVYNDVLAFAKLMLK